MNNIKLCISEKISAEIGGMANKIIKKKNEIRSKKDTAIRRKLGNILVEAGLLSAEKLDEALEAQKVSGKRLGQILIEMKVITEEETAFALAMQLKIPFIDLSDYAIEQKLLDSIPLEVSRKFLCIPIALKNNILEVAMSDPLDLNTIKDLQFITGYNIQPAISTSTQIAQSLQKHHHPESLVYQHHH